MQIIRDINSSRIIDNDEHITIKRRLVRYFSYYNKFKDIWYKITNFSDPECAKEYILIRYKNGKTSSRQTLQLPYPFRLDTDLIYLWGLIAGAAYKKERLEICVDTNQEEIIQNIADRLKIQVKIEYIKRKRKKRGSKPTIQPYQKLRVLFPPVFKRFLSCIGYCNRNLSIPKWLRSNQRMTWLEGYLNSKKVQCNFHKLHKNNFPVPRLGINVSQDNPRLLHDISEILDQLNITYYIAKWKNGHQIYYQIQINSRVAIFKLTKKFFIRRPKLRALLAIFRKVEDDPAFWINLLKYNLTDFQLYLYGMVIDQPLQELEYTLFEKTIGCNNYIIRQDLYLLDKIGLINYYKKENNKEYIIRSTRYLRKASQTLKYEEIELLSHLKYSSSNALSFHCDNCNQIVSYTDAMINNSFQCPQCASKNLHPIDISKCFYPEKIGLLMRQQETEKGVV